MQDPRVHTALQSDFAPRLHAMALSFTINFPSYPMVGFSPLYTYWELSELAHSPVATRKLRVNPHPSPPMMGMRKASS